MRRAPRPKVHQLDDPNLVGTNAKLAVIRWKEESESDGGTKLTWREIGARLVQEGAALNGTDKYGRTPVYLASQRCVPRCKRSCTMCTRRRRPFHPVR